MHFGPWPRRASRRHHYHHYRGFFATQRKLLERQEPKRLKPVLYAYRVLLTGIHLLRTGEVEAHLPLLAQEYQQPFLLELVVQKREEKAAALGLDWAFHDAQLKALEAQLDRAYQESSLPRKATGKPSALLVASHWATRRRSSGNLSTAAGYTVWTSPCRTSRLPLAYIRRDTCT